jgi:hypothetical protein
MSLNIKNKNFIVTLIERRKIMTNNKDDFLRILSYLEFIVDVDNVGKSDIEFIKKLFNTLPEEDQIQVENELNGFITRALRFHKMYDSCFL